jgi:hypothetical protein
MCYNCNQLGHLSHDCPNLCTTCTYCRELDHAIEYCPQILMKWKERGNQNHNPYQNLYKISPQMCNEGPRIEVVTRGGTRTWVDAINGGKQAEQWVKKLAITMPIFGPQQEKDMYRRERKEILGPDWETSTSSMSHVCDCTMP